YWFTSSTSFANPAVTIGRMLSDSFTGIAPGSVPAFVAFQIVGAAVAVVIVRGLYPEIGRAARDVVVPHTIEGPSPDGRAVVPNLEDRNESR
ncbi:MAG TPA: aquaporin, partial [Acidimicrobiia bacterium]